MLTTRRTSHAIRCIPGFSSKSDEAGYDVKNLDDSNIGPPAGQRNFAHRHSASPTATGLEVVENAINKGDPQMVYFAVIPRRMLFATISDIAVRSNILAISRRWAASKPKRPTAFVISTVT